MLVPFWATNDPRQDPTLWAKVASTPDSGQEVLLFQWRRHFHSSVFMVLCLIILHGREEVTPRIHITERRNLTIKNIDVLSLSSRKPMHSPQNAEWRVGVLTT